MKNPSSHSNGGGLVGVITRDEQPTNVEIIIRKNSAGGSNAEKQFDEPSVRIDQKPPAFCTQSWHVAASSTGICKNIGKIMFDNDMM